MLTAKYLRKAAALDRAFGARQSGFKVPQANAAGPNQQRLARAQSFQLKKGKIIEFEIDMKRGRVKTRFK